MKIIKKFEAYQTPDEQKEKDETQIEILQDLINENPLSKDHDFYIFLGSDKFKETKDGLYKKVLEIERMVRITPDIQSIGAMKGMQMRAMVQQGVKLYHIWLPVEIRADVDGKGYSLEPWIVDLINKHKSTGTDDHGKNVYKKISKEVPERRANMKKYNL